MADQPGPAHGHTDTPSKSPLTDRFKAGPILIVLVLAAVFFFSSYASDNFDSYGGIWFFALFFALVAAVANLVLLVIRLGRRRWRASISVAAALGILVICFLARDEILFGIDWARFQIFRTHYIAALESDADPASTKGPRILTWGFYGYFMTGEFYRKLVYDGTDEIATPNGLDSSRVRQVIQGTMENSHSNCKPIVRQIEGHYYLVDIACT
jgi:amino acid transporter